MTSGKPAKRRRQAEREAVPRALREHPDLARQLRIQLRFLRRSARAYDDEGDADEARRMATTIRLLVHQTNSSHALLVQLGIRDRLQWQSYGQPIEESNLMPSIPGLFFMRSDEAGGRYVARTRADVVGPIQGVQFSEWWATPASRISGKRTISRERYVLMAANHEGGAHVDPLLDELWRELETENPFGWSYSVGDETRPLAGHAGLISIRTIAEEVLDTLEPMEPFLPAEAPK